MFDKKTFACTFEWHWHHKMKHDIDGELIIIWVHMLFTVQKTDKKDITNLD